MTDPVTPQPAGPDFAGVLRCRSCLGPIVARENRPPNDERGPYMHMVLTPEWYERPHDAFPVESRVQP